MIKALILSPGPVLTCLIVISLLLVFFLLSIQCGFLYDKANTRIFFAIISVICLRMTLPVNFPFTYSIYIKDFVRPVMDVLSVSIADTSFMVFDCLYGIWAIGAVIQLCRFLKAKKVYTDRIREFIITKKSSYAYLYDFVQKHSPKPIKIAVVPMPISPSITGIFEPVLILPEVDDFSQKELTYIFDHELYHYKKHDLILLLLIDIVCCIHWWNPLVYVLKKWFCLAMEITNDQAIMQGRDSTDRLDYASLIIKISKKLQNTKNTTIYNLDFVGSKHSQLKLRIKYLYKDSHNKKYLSVIKSLELLFLTILLIFSLFFVIESEATVTPADTEGSVVITEENSYFIKSENGYDLYVEGNYLVSFDKIPAAILIFLVAYLSISGSCVTITIVFPCRCCFFKSAMIFPLFPESRFPVGSSARMISGSFISALAMATLCFSPPDNFLQQSVCTAHHFFLFLSRIAGRKAYIFHHIQFRDQIEGLKHIAESLISQSCLLIPDKVCYIFPIKKDLSRCAGIQQSYHIQQGRFPGAGFSVQHNKLSLFNLKINVAQDFVFNPLSIVAFADIL